MAGFSEEILKNMSQNDMAVFSKEVLEKMIANVPQKNFTEMLYYVEDKRYLRNSYLELNFWFDLIKVSDYSIFIEDFLIWSKPAPKAAFKCCDDRRVKEIDEIMKKSVEFGKQLDVTINSGSSFIASFSNVRHFFTYFDPQRRQNEIQFVFDSKNVNEKTAYLLDEQAIMHQNMRLYHLPDIPITMPPISVSMSTLKI